MDIGKNILLATVACAFSSFCFGTESELVNQSSKDLRVMLFVFCVVVSVIVFSVLVYSTIYHRQSAYFDPSAFRRKMSSEVMWVLLPIAMLVGMAIPSAVNVIGVDELGEFKKQAYVLLSGSRGHETPKIDPKPL